MSKINKTGVFIFLVLIFFCYTIISINQYKIETEINQKIMSEEAKNQYISYNLEIGKNALDNRTIEKSNEKQSDKITIWQIQIPIISLEASIAEGTDEEILDKYVGHFEMTSKTTGNIGLAAHNRGYEVNYFKDLKILKQGDEIIYKYNDFEKNYEVEECRIIKDTDWNYLEETEDNMLTLITCVENQPEYRRCIQAIEKEEE